MFLWPWWNRYLGLSLDGYMPWFGHRILNGEIPYRDFFLHLPPLHPLAEAALEAVVGKSILAGRVAGAAGHILLAALVAGWLARRFRPVVAVVTTLAALVLASSDDTEILDLYNPHAALAAIVSGLLACVALDGGRHARLAGWMSGVAAGAAFWTKQTIGLGATLAVPAALGLLAVGDAQARVELRRLAARFAAGWGALALAIGGWLAANGALVEFVRQVFGAAAQSKGSPLHLLLRPWMAAFELRHTAGPALLATVVALAAVAGARWREPIARTASRPWLSALAGLAVAVLLIAPAARLAPLLFGLAGARQSLAELRNGRHLGIFFGLYGVTALGALAAWYACRRRSSSHARELTIFVVVAGAIALTQALSNASTGASALPALALVATYVVDGVAKRGGARLLAVPVTAVVVLALVSGVELHRRLPFAFAGWNEPTIERSTARSREAALAGLRLSPTTAHAVDGILAAIRAASDVGEPIFTFPVYPIFHWLADRPTATFASLHWIDVTPDAIVDRDLSTLLSEPPVVIVRQWQEDRPMTINEGYFRAGRESAFRRMNEALDRLLAARYRRVFAFHGGGMRRRAELEVWVRADRAEERALQSLP